MGIKIELPKIVVHEAKFLHAIVRPRYFDDATVDGVEDNPHDVKMPFVKDFEWQIHIDLDDGRIVDWPKGVTASTHYKVCDSGTYILLDKDYNRIGIVEDNYVPKCLSPKSDGYGDYVILDIDSDGYILFWKPYIEDLVTDIVELGVVS